MIEPNRTIAIQALVVPSEPRQKKQTASVVIIDVLRATTSIVVALSAGARCIYPKAEIEDARSFAAKLPVKALLAGERNGERIEGFDLGNSPLEFDAETVADRSIIMCTTNGTRALENAIALKSSLIITSSIVNLSASVAAVAESDEILIMCSGREGYFSLEDSFCAGGIIAHLHLHAELILNDGARACLSIWDQFKDNPHTLLQTASHGKYLAELGYGKDLQFCAQMDTIFEVPHWNGSSLTLLRSVGDG